MTAGWTPETLPEVLPVFPLTGVLLLPGGRLPLNVFEPRYRAMVEACLGTPDRLIGMIQPLDPDDRAREPDLYRIGCAGRLTAFEETADGRYLITLTGVSRFAVVEELPLRQGFRPMRVTWRPFASDLAEAEPPDFDRARLLKGLRGYLKHHGVAADWSSIEQAPDDVLITTLAMVCPFAPSEKQALLESADTEDRASTMIALIEMAMMDKDLPGSDLGLRH